MIEEATHSEIKGAGTGALLSMNRQQAADKISNLELPRRRDTRGLPRVLIVSGQSSGGIWHYTCLLSTALKKSGVDVALATMSPFEPLQGVEAVPIWPIGSHPARAPSSRAAELSRHAIGHADKMRRLIQLIAKYRPGIVHLQDRIGQIDFLYMKLLRHIGIRIVVTAHDARRLSGKANWFDRARNHEADMILVHSANGVRELIADRIDASKITQIRLPNFLDLSGDYNLPREEARHLLGISTAARSILFFGTIAPYKGLDVLLHAFSRVSQEDPYAHLMIAGEPLEDFAPYRLLIDKLGLTDRVLTDLRYIPFAEFPNFFRSADVVVLPYRRIYQSGVLLLAYGFERPVIVTNVGGLHEAVAEDRTGIIVSADDPINLALAIRRLFVERGAAEEMGRRGRRLAETKYSWTALAEDVSGVYRSVYRGGGLKAGG